MAMHFQISWSSVCESGCRVAFGIQATVDLDARRVCDLSLIASAFQSARGLLASR